MNFKVSILCSITLEKCVQSVTFNVEPPSDDYTSRRTYPINSMIINGKIDTDEKTIPLYEWALIPATDPNCYKDITVEETQSDQVIRKVNFSKAFVVDYSERFSNNTGVGYFSLFVRQLAGTDVECTSSAQQTAKAELKSPEIKETKILPQTQEEQVLEDKSLGKTTVGGISFTDGLIASKKEMQFNNQAPTLEDKRAVQARVDDIKNVMSEEEKKRTTFGVALVRTKDGKKEFWVSSAGQKGIVRTDIRKNDRVIKNKVPEGDIINRLNDAEQSLMRAAEEQEVEIVAMGATRDMCPVCQEVAMSKGLLNKMVTPLKK
jgi:hypothetical protein